MNGIDREPAGSSLAGKVTFYGKNARVNPCIKTRVVVVVRRVKTKGPCGAVKCAKTYKCANNHICANRLAISVPATGRAQ